VQAVDAAGIDVAEIGYRTIHNSHFAGAFKFTDEALVNALPPLKHTRLAVMLDAREFLGQEDAVDRLFVPATESRIAIVRVATRMAHLDSAEDQVSRLRALGYQTALNIMAWASVPDAERAPTVDRLLSSVADAVYIADSFGSLFPKDIHAFADLLDARQEATGLEKPWGVHLHNNLELAFANALAAMERGATWIDSSVLGMGRGPGNLKTELLLQWLERQRPHDGYHAAPIYSLIGRHWQHLHAQYQWGPRTPYVLSGFLAVHPSYAQELLESERYTTDEVVAILRRLYDTGAGRSFSHEALLTALAARSNEPQPSKTRSLVEWRPGSWQDLEILVIGRGPSTSIHAAAINRFIETRNPIVIECNLNGAIMAGSDHLVAFVVRSNASTMVRPALDAHKSVLLAVDDTYLDVSNDDDVFHGVHRVRAGECDPIKGVAPADVVSMFAINTAVARGAERIYVVGFDGYPPESSARERRMQIELEEYFELLKVSAPGLAIVSLTPTRFPIRSASLYGVLQGIETS